VTSRYLLAEADQRLDDRRLSTHWGVAARFRSEAAGSAQHQKGFNFSSVDFAVEIRTQVVVTLDSPPVVSDIETPRQEMAGATSAH
jgi:hypothetical protein